MNTTIQCELILFTICPIILSKEQICKSKFAEISF